MARRPLRPSYPRVVTLSTDMGSAYAAQMKAVLAQSLPPASIVDLTHDLRPHDLSEAAFVLREVVRRYPSGAVHLVVVDPGVGGRRRPIVLACRDGTTLVGPDNGLLTALAETRGRARAYALATARLRAGARVGTTFDGRDLFAPAAARLALGASARELGAPTVPRSLPRVAARRSTRGAAGRVVHTDRFGNLITNVPSAWPPAGVRTVIVRIGGRAQTLRLVRAYEEGNVGTSVLLRSSFGTLELAVRQGRATDRLGVGVGAAVRFTWAPAPDSPSRRKRKKRPL